jgi:hypothetical protein
MRTKTILLAAVLSAAGAATSQAQVYSVNAVGYVNVSVTNTFQLVANQLNAADSKISTILPAPPEGTQVFTWNGAGFDTFEFIAVLGWFPNGDATLTPGGGAFIRNPAANPATAPIVITFVGEVPQGALSNPLPLGFSIKSSQVPQDGTLDTGAATSLNFPATAGDQVFKWTGSGYDTYEFIDVVGWFPAAPAVKVGEAFFVNKVGTAGTWTRTFTVSP